MIIEMRITFFLNLPEGGGVVEVFGVPDLHGLVDLEVGHPDLRNVMIVKRKTTTMTTI